MSDLDVSLPSSRKQMELHAEFLIKSVEEIERTNHQLRGGKRKQLEAETSKETSADVSTLLIPPAVENSSHGASEKDLRCHRSLADDLSSCAGVPSRVLPHMEERSAVDERLREIQSNSELKIRQLQHRVSHLEEQLALSHAENERLKQANILKPLHRRKDDDDSQNLQYLNKLLVQQRSLIQENGKLKRELVSMCVECRRRTATKEQPPTPARRPTFQSSARHVLENLPRQQRKDRLSQRRTWSTPPPQS